jgi:transcriptional regulator with XRE-family HTH domain
LPRKILASADVPSLAAERLLTWGQAIRTQRVRQRLSADQLCARIGISRATLSRLERGDPAVSVAGYMGAFLVLGIFDRLMPSPDATLWSPDEKGRVRARQTEADSDYF